MENGDAVVSYVAQWWAIKCPIMPHAQHWLAMGMSLASQHPFKFCLDTRAQCHPSLIADHFVFGMHWRPALVPSSLRPIYSQNVIYIFFRSIDYYNYWIIAPAYFDFGEAVPYLHCIALGRRTESRAILIISSVHVYTANSFAYFFHAQRKTLLFNCKVQ